MQDSVTFPATNQYRCVYFLIFAEAGFVFISAMNGGTGAGLRSESETAAVVVWQFGHLSHDQ